MTVVRWRFRFLRESVDVVDSVGLVEDPATHHGQPLPGLGGADGVGVRLARDRGRVCREVTLLADLYGPGRDKG